MILTGFGLKNFLLQLWMNNTKSIYFEEEIKDVTETHDTIEIMIFLLTECWYKVPAAVPSVLVRKLCSDEGAEG